MAVDGDNVQGDPTRAALTRADKLSQVFAHEITPQGAVMRQLYTGGPTRRANPGRETLGGQNILGLESGDKVSRLFAGKLDDDVVKDEDTALAALLDDLQVPKVVKGDEV